MLAPTFTCRLRQSHLSAHDGVGRKATLPRILRPAALKLLPFGFAVGFDLSAQDGVARGGGTTGPDFCFETLCLGPPRTWRLAASASGRVLLALDPIVPPSPAQEVQPQRFSRPCGVPLKEQDNKNVKQTLSCTMRLSRTRSRPRCCGWGSETVGGLTRH